MCPPASPAIPHWNMQAKTLDDILKDAVPIEEGRKSPNSKIYQKPGGLPEAQEVFDDFGPGKTENYDTKYGKVTVKELPDGTKVVHRHKSSDGRPTVEVQRVKGKKVKIRIGEKEGQ